MLTLTEFLLARIAEDEAAAKAVPPLEHNYDMGGNRQDERFTFGRTLPSSMDGRGNTSPHRDSPTTRAHFERHDPARVLAECEAKRRIVELHTPDHECTDGSDSYPGVMGAGMYEPYCPTLRALALPYADHPDYREEWKP